MIEASNKRNLALEKYFFDLEIIKPKAKNSDDETMLHILNDVNIRVIAKVEGNISKRLAVRVCGIIKITFAIDLL